MEEENTSISKEEKLTYKEKLKFASVIAEPMATKSLCKKLYKLIKKASQEKGYIRVGLKDVQKAIRREENGIMVFGGDVSPIDIMIHMPVVCEEHNIPYCFTPSRADIGHAAGFNRAVVLVLIKEHDNYKELYSEIKKELQGPTF